MSISDKTDETTLKQEIGDSVKTEIYQRVTRWLLGCFVAILAFAALGIWGYLRPWLSTQIGGVPKGAVIAFDLNGECPEKWITLQETFGRVIIGAGDLDSVPNNLKLYENGALFKGYKHKETGGEQEVALRPSDIPDHSHSLAEREGYVRNDSAAGGAIYLENKRTGNMVPTAAFSETKHNNVPPFIALTFCKKN